MIIIEYLQYSYHRYYITLSTPAHGRRHIKDTRMVYDKTRVANVYNYRTNGRHLLQIKLDAISSFPALSECNYLYLTSIGGCSKVCNTRRLVHFSRKYVPGKTIAMIITTVFPSHVYIATCTVGCGG